MSTKLLMFIFSIFILRKLNWLLIWVQKARFTYWLYYNLKILKNYNGRLFILFINVCKKNLRMKTSVENRRISTQSTGTSQKHYRSTGFKTKIRFVLYFSRFLIEILKVNRTSIIFHSEQLEPSHNGCWTGRRAKSR